MRMQRQLVALSGLAILLVVLHHSIDMQISGLSESGIGLPTGWQLYLLAGLHRLGKVAVPLFLFISGGFIAYAARGNPPKLSWSNVQAALRRIIWPYLLWSIIFYVLVFFQRHESYSVAGYLKNLVVGYPFHFVPLLIFFYAISPLLTYTVKRFGLALIVLLAIGQLALITVEFPGALAVSGPEWMHHLSPPVIGHTLALWGIYFPLGLFCSLNFKYVQPWLQRLRWPLIALTLTFFLLDVLHTAAVIHLPVAVHIYPLTFVLLAPLIKRNFIPKVEAHEYVGKRSYGLYLTHLLVIHLALSAVQEFVPLSPGIWLLATPLLLVAPLFILGVALPLLVMHLLSAPPIRIAHRYVFG
jgi:peptidoglycan/LPS O-acetylase OafA/YrhL